MSKEECHVSERSVRDYSPRGGLYPFQAHIWQQALQQEGIHCQVLGDYLNAGIGDIPGLDAEVWVEAADLAGAEAILDHHRGHREEAAQSEVNL